MKFPCSTGEGARFLGTSEPVLAETVRRGKVAPEPQIIAGRRLWTPSQLLQAATALDLLTEDIQDVLEAEAARQGATAKAPEAGGRS